MYIRFVTRNVYGWAGARPTNDISIEFEIKPKLEMLWFKMYQTDHNEILHTSRQYNWRDVCKVSLWSVENILNSCTQNFDRISDLIEIPLVGRGPGPILRVDTLRIEHVCQ